MGAAVPQRCNGVFELLLNLECYNTYMLHTNMVENVEVTHLGQSLLTLCAHIPSTCAYLHDCRSFCFVLEVGQLRLFLLLSCGALKVTVSVWLIG